MDQLETREVEDGGRRTVEEDEEVGVVAEEEEVTVVMVVVAQVEEVVVQTLQVDRIPLLALPILRSARSSFLPRRKRTERISHNI